jgi:hypothetical protein
MPVPTRLRLDPAEMQVLAALRAFRHEIVEAERRFGVDRRAIAGAIAWEMLENVRPWSALRPLARSVGFGKVHVYNFSVSPLSTLASQTEDRGFLPKQSFEDRRRLLATPEGAITYIGGTMAAIADVTGYHGFDDVRRDPVMLTQVFQQHTLDSWSNYLKDKRRGTPFVPQNRMALWVSSHLTFLEEAVGPPSVKERAANASQSALEAVSGVSRP